MAKLPGYSTVALGLLWPALLAEQTSELAAAFAHGLLGLAEEDTGEPPEPGWTTRNDIVLELESVRLRRFGRAGMGQALLICAPFALHGAMIADMAPGYSLVEALQNVTRGPLFVIDWRSANVDMRSRSIDHYLADLNVLVDEIGGPVDLVGLCQGGWMGLVYAARFPAKVRRLVLAGAPIDIAAGASTLSRLAQSTPMSVFRELVQLGDGLMLGRRLFRLWEPDVLDCARIRAILQTPEGMDGQALRRLEARFNEWHGWTVNLPGRYYLEVVERLYLNNMLATGRFVALGQRIDVATLRIPMFLLTARDDQVAAPEQTLRVRELAASAAIRCALAPCDHLGLFMGRRTLADQWQMIGDWLKCSDAALSETAA